VRRQAKEAQVGGVVGDAFGQSVARQPDQQRELWAERTTPGCSSCCRRRSPALPQWIRRTANWDRGRERSSHARFTIGTGFQVYFCDPHSPWRRGSIENTNELLRRYLPKGTDPSLYSPEDTGWRRPQPQQPPPQDPRICETVRETRRVPCTERLSPRRSVVPRSWQPPFDP
jgi:hypothetical protein